jgi:hypothetical protein
MIKIHFIFVLFVFSFSSCFIFSHNDFEKVKTKKIKIEDIKNDTLLSYENKEVKLLFSKSQIIEIIEKELSKRKGKIEDRNRCVNFVKFIDTTSGPILTKSLSMLNQNSSDNIQHTLIFEIWLLEEMLINGNVRVFDKKNQKYVDYIIFNKSRDKMDSYREYFSLPDNTHFFTSYIELGE